MASVQVIRRRKSDPLGDTLGALGQGLSGFASGYMGKKQMDMMQQNSQAQQRMMERLFGKDGSGISAQGLNDQFSGALDDTLAGKFGDAAGDGESGELPGMGELPGTAQNVPGGGAAPAVTAAALGLGAGMAGGSTRVIKKKKSAPRSVLSDIGQALFDPGGFFIPSLTNTDPWALSYGKLTGGI